MIFHPVQTLSQLTREDGGWLGQAHQTIWLLTERDGLPDQHTGSGRVLWYPEVGRNSSVKRKVMDLPAPKLTRSPPASPAMPHRTPASPRR